MIHENLDKYIRLVGGLAGRDISTATTSTLTLDSYNYQGIRTVFHFNQRIELDFHSINIKLLIKLKDLPKLVTPYGHAYYALNNLKSVLRYNNAR